MARKKQQTMTSSQATGGGRRRIVFGVGIVLFCAVVAGGVVAGRQAMAQASGYGLVALEVHGLRLLTGDEILRASGLTPGQSIFSVDLDEAAQRIDSLVWVDHARVERRPPDRLVVTIMERRRTVWLDWYGDLLGLDDDGVVLPRGRLTTEGVADLDLPIIRPGHTLSPAAELGDAADAGEQETAAWSPVVGEPVPDEHEVRRLLTWWLRARRQAPQLAPEISEILSLDEESVRLRLVADELEVRLPLGDDDCLLALLGVLERVYHDVPNAAYVDLRYRGQAVVGTRRSEAARAPQPPVNETGGISHG